VIAAGPFFSAARIAKQLGKAASTVRQALAKIDTKETVEVAGQIAKAWAFEVLPDGMRAELDRLASERGYRSGREMLERAGEPWQPEVALKDILPADREKAEKRCRAFAETWKRMKSPALSDADVVEIGLRDYRREFGHAIDERTWRRIRERAIKRDRGLNQFNRPELFLDEDARRAGADIEAVAKRNSWEPLLGEFATANSNSELSDEKIVWLWMTAFDRLKLEDEQSATFRRLRAELLEFVFGTFPAIAKSAEALRKQFELRWARWTESGGSVRSIMDKRTAPFRTKQQLTDDQKKPIVAYTIHHAEGRLAQGIREMNQAGKLPEGVTLPAGAHSKSYVPRRLREQLQPLVNEQLIHHRGIRRGSGAHLDRDWSNLFAGDSWTSDDCTLPVYVWTLDENGRQVLTRGQWLPLLCERSLKLIAFKFLPTPTYNSLAIRSLFTSGCMDVGLPRRRFLLEKGIWKNSRILTGREAAAPAGWEKVETGFAAFADIRFVHAGSARVKVVETFLRLFQNLLSGEPGYIGRAEREVYYQKVQRQKLDVEAGRARAEEFFYSSEQWVQRLFELGQFYNADSQEGDLLGGLSPSQAFVEFNKADSPLIKLPPELRYLLAHHRMPQRVTRNGIQFQIGKLKYHYLDEKLGPFVGHTVLVWFDPDNADAIVITDQDERNPILVSRLQAVPVIDGGEALSAAQRQIRAFESHHRGYYRSMEKDLAHTRRLIPDAHALELAQKGVEIESQRMAADAKEKTKRTRLERMDAIARELGFANGAADLSENATLESLERMRDSRRRRTANKAEEAHP